MQKKAYFSILTLITMKIKNMHVFTFLLVNSVCELMAYLITIGLLDRNVRLRLPAHRD